jgi:talin
VRTSALTCHLNVVGAASSQEQLAVAAQNAVSTIVQLAEVVKFGAASLGSSNPEAQVS